MFKELAKQDPNFKIGLDIKVNRPLRALALLSSASRSIHTTKSISVFSPISAYAGQRFCQHIIEKSLPLKAILQWGATFTPVLDQSRIPYFIITDGPWDPDDQSYPEEWRPGRWSRSFFKFQNKLFSSAQAVFTLSEWARQKVVSVHNLPDTRVVAIGWGPLNEEVEPSLIVPIKPRFVAIGSQYFRKGMDVVREAGRLAHQCNSQIETIIAGAPEGFVIEECKGGV